MNDTLQALRELLKTQQIYVQVIVPKDVALSRSTDYTPSYVAHTDPARLSQDVIDQLWHQYRRAEKCKAEGERGDPSDEIEDFITSLEDFGYLCFHSGYEPLVIIDRDELVFGS